MALTALPKLCSRSHVAVSSRTRVPAVVRCQASTTSGNGNTSSSSRRFILGAGLSTAIISVPMSAKARDLRVGEVQHSEQEWMEILGEESYNVLRRAGTERAGTSPLNKEARVGTFVCGGCGSPLFSSETKYDAGTGWPSFYDVIPGAVDTTTDYTFGIRTEVRCHRCQGHLGHMFNDGPPPTGLRYCMNGVSLKFNAA